MYNKLNFKYLLTFNYNNMEENTPPGTFHRHPNLINNKTFFKIIIFKKNEINICCNYSGSFLFIRIRANGRPPI